MSEKQMTPEEAHKHLVDGINAATQKGVFNLSEVSILILALQITKPKKDEN